MANNIMPVSFDYTILNATPVTPTPIQSLFDDVEALFVDWLQKQPSQRNPSITLLAAKHYAQELRQVGDPQFDIVVGRNLYTVVDPAEYEVLYTEIKQHTGFSAYNQARGNGYFSAALDYYRTFLSDSEIRRILKIMIDTAPILAALRTKPFILLAGISGTGKSRMVRQLARGCCPDSSDLAKDPKDKTKPAGKPGNFEMIQVRPNWHDSTELMGYVTRITQSKEPEYVLTPFVKFLVKAWLHPETPFFLCLDEMNLAPVEQYFAEYLSVIETRRVERGSIMTDVLVNFDVAQCPDSVGKSSTDQFVKKTAEALLEEYKPKAASPVDPKVTALEASIKADKGLRIPPNLVVMGTVNMDETTCTFSRKVLDRAMSFELNKVDMGEGLEDDNGIDYGAIAASEATPRLLNGRDAWTENQPFCETVKAYLVEINTVLDKTPFKIAYRSRDEIMVYCLERTKGREDMLAQALDEATSMKILSRIEGDNQHVKKDLLDGLKNTIGNELAKLPGFDKEKNTVCSEKLKDMIEQAEFGYTSFWLR